MTSHYSLLIAPVGAPFLEKISHVRGYGTFEVHLLSCPWMPEPKGPCMESLSRAGLETVLNKLFVFCEGSSLEYSVATIPGIVEEGMSLGEHVYPDLVGSSGLKYAFDARNVSESFDHLIMRHRMFSDLRIIEDSHLELIAWISSYITYDRAFVLIEISPHEGHIFTSSGLVEKLESQVSLGFGSLGYHKQSAGILVYAVNESESRVADIVVWIVAEVIGECVDESTVIIAMSRMNYQSSRFIDDHYV